MFLISLNDKIECTVCGGTGSGMDGAYQVEAIEDPASAAKKKSEEVNNVVSISDDREVDIVDKEPSTENAAESQTPTHMEGPQSTGSSIEEVKESQLLEEEYKDGVSTEEDGSLEKGVTDVSTFEPNASTKEEQSMNGVASVASVVSTRSASEKLSVTVASSEHNVSRADSDMRLQVETPSIDHREVIGSPRSTAIPRSASKTTPCHPTPDIGPSFDECPDSPSGSAARSVTELKDDFEAKRLYVSREIGKMMMKGWMLLDLSCSECLMPLLSDPQTGQETCVLCGPSATLPMAITVDEQKHGGPPVDPPSADEEDVVITQTTTLKDETKVVEMEIKDANEPKQMFSLQLPASFDMTDEAALRTLIALVKANQSTVKAEVKKEELPPRPSPVISTAHASDDVSHVTMDTPTNVQIQSPHTPAVSQAIDVPGILQQESTLSQKSVDAPGIIHQESRRSGAQDDIYEQEAGVEIMRKVSSREPFDEPGASFGEQCSIDGFRNTAESFGDYPVEAPKRELTTDEDSIASRYSKILEKLESCSVTSRLVSEAAHRESRECDEGSIASPHSEISRYSEDGEILQRASYTSRKDAGSISIRRSKLSPFSETAPEIEKQLSLNSRHSEEAAIKQQTSYTPRSYAESVSSRRSKLSVYTQPSEAGPEIEQQLSLNSRQSEAAAIKQQTSYTPRSYAESVSSRRSKLSVYTQPSEAGPEIEQELSLNSRHSEAAAIKQQTSYTPRSDAGSVSSRRSKLSVYTQPSEAGPEIEQQLSEDSGSFYSRQSKVSVSSRRSRTPVIEEQTSYTSLTSEQELEYARQFNAGSCRVSPLPSPQSSPQTTLPPRPSFRPLTPTSPPARMPRRTSPRFTGTSPSAGTFPRGPPRPEDFGKKSPAASSPSVRSFRPLTPPQKRALPPFPGSSPREVRYHRRDDSSARSHVSRRSGSVASQALESIMKRIEECKFNIISSDDPEYQAHQAALLEKLGTAAVAMKRLEESV
jgi:uncharacterized Zn finger protein (UPF0148 family)